MTLHDKEVIGHIGLRILKGNNFYWKEDVKKEVVEKLINLCNKNIKIYQRHLTPQFVDKEIVINDFQELKDKIIKEIFGEGLIHSPQDKTDMGKWLPETSAFDSRSNRLKTVDNIQNSEDKKE